MRGGGGERGERKGKGKETLSKHESWDVMMYSWVLVYCLKA